MLQSWLKKLTFVIGKRFLGLSGLTGILFLKELFEDEFMLAAFSVVYFTLDIKNRFVL